MQTKNKRIDSTGTNTNQLSTVQIKNTSLKKPNSAILFAGLRNIIEIEGSQGNVSISVTTGATIRKIAENKFEVIPSRKGSFLITVSQNNKLVGSKEYTAVSK